MKGIANIKQRKIIAVLLVSILLTGGFIIWKKAQEPTSYNECIAKKDARVEQDAPERCMYKGKAYVEYQSTSNVPIQEDLCAINCELQQVEPGEEPVDEGPNLGDQSE